jgi:hypothetical protein
MSDSDSVCCSEATVRLEPGLGFGLRTRGLPYPLLPVLKYAPLQLPTSHKISRQSSSLPDPMGCAQNSQWRFKQAQILLIGNRWLLALEDARGCG